MTSPIPSILNFRDVGKTINALTGKQIMKEGKLFRSARPDEATSEDLNSLTTHYGIKSIIDLRTKTEHIEQSKKMQDRATTDSKPTIQVPLQIPGTTYHHVNFNGRAYANSLLAQLTWSQYLLVILWMATGYRRDAIRIIGENVMASQGLIGLARDSLDACVVEVKEFFSIIAQVDEAGPVLVHCTQGKDRTGLTVLLVLLLLDVPLKAAEEDYIMSARELEVEREERVREIESIGLPAWFADCDPGFVKAVDTHVKEKYGGIGKYLEGLGVDGVMQDRIRDILLV